MPGILAPVAHVWGFIAERRLRADEAYRCSLPVICVGNFTAGGTGKTPLSIKIARELARCGERPAILTRGYGGRHVGPHRVDPALDVAADVGDESLLLARHARTVVARRRAAGAQMIEADAGQTPPTVIIMDDGFQNPALHKDLSIVVVDGRRGFGNERVIPAGPLRAPLAAQLERADALVVNRPRHQREGDDAVAAMLRQRFMGPVLEAWTEPETNGDALAGERLLALAGIANPGRFTELLRAIGAEVAETITFPDHHAFQAHDASYVLARAARLGAKIVTTEKDWVRLIGQPGPLAELREAAQPVPIQLKMTVRDEKRLMSLLMAVSEGAAPHGAGAAQASSLRSRTCR